jgi:hypothetical protein
MNDTICTYPAPPRPFYTQTDPVPRARVVRQRLKAAELADLVTRVTSGTRTTWVYMAWSLDDTMDQRYEKARQVAAALRPLWTDGETRVHVLYAGAVTIGRDVLIRNEGAQS